MWAINVTFQYKMIIKEVRALIFIGILDFLAKHFS